VASREILGFESSTNQKNPSRFLVKLRLEQRNKRSPENEEAGLRNREWKDFPKPAARWTLDRV
jgi:hypothetical protein